MALANRFGHLVDVEGPLRNQNHVGAAGDAAVQGDPAGVASHYGNYHHAVMCLSSRVKTVNRFTHYVAGGIKSEGIVRSAQIVVNGLGNSDYVQAFFVEFLGDRQGIVPSDGDQGVNLVLLDGGDASVDSIRAFRRVGARRAQNGSATGQNSTDRVQVERHALVFDQTAPALHETDELIVIMKYTLTYHRADDGVQPWAI